MESNANGYISFTAKKSETRAPIWKKKIESQRKKEMESLKNDRQDIAHGKKINSKNHNNITSDNIMNDNVVKKETEEIFDDYESQEKVPFIHIENEDGNKNDENNENEKNESDDYDFKKNGNAKENENENTKDNGNEKEGEKDDTFETQNKHSSEDKKMQWIKECEYLIVSGGAAKGISMVSCLETLLELYPPFLSQLKGCAGTSIGSTIALFCVCASSDPSISIKSLCSNALDPNMWSQSNLIPFVHPLFLTEKCGVCSHEFLSRKVDTLFKILHLHSDITFKQLYEKTKRIFTCNATRMSNLKSVSFDHISFPNLKVKTALIMTMCVPFLFEPVEWEEDYYCDGGALKNYMYDVFPLEKSLGISTTCWDNPDNMDCYREKGFGFYTKFLSQIFSKTRENSEPYENEKIRERIIPILIPKSHGFVMGASPMEILKLYDYGKSSMLWFLFGERYVQMKRLENLKMALYCIFAEVRKIDNRYKKSDNTTSNNNNGNVNVNANVNNSNNNINNNNNNINANNNQNGQSSFMNNTNIQKAENTEINQENKPLLLDKHSKTFSFYQTIFSILDEKTDNNKPFVLKKEEFR